MVPTPNIYKFLYLKKNEPRKPNGFENQVSATGPLGLLLNFVIRLRKIITS